MAEAYPLQWPNGKPRTNYRHKARFDVAFAKARDELMREISLLGGTLPVVSTNIPLRRDNLPYANQPEPSDPGVAVYFQYKEQQMCFACDRWDKVKDNIQAVRHTIAALRGIERWGTGDMVQQAFTGFAALPSPDAKKPWWEILGVNKDASPENIKLCYRHKAKLAHPDLGGSVEQMQELNEAAQAAGIR